jgi:hypothetical protein
MLGVPEAAASAFSARLAAILGPVAKKFPRLAKLAGRITRRLGSADKDAELALHTERRAIREAEAAELMAADRLKKRAYDAVEFVEKHPSIKGKPGHRVADAGGGHHITETVDKNVATGIACDYESPKPHIRVPCPRGMGTKETVEEFEKRGGRVTQVEPQKTPKSEAQVTGVRESPPPEGFEDLPDLARKTRQQARVNLAEDHHIASRYIKANRKIFDRLGLSIDDELNLITNFEEHGQLRGWYDWKKGGYAEFKMKGHHREYNQWVTKLLKDATPKGLAPDESLRRVTKVLEELKVLIRAHPEVLSHGPGISPLLQHLKFTWE